jgi:hypothetical protein
MLHPSPYVLHPTRSNLTVEGETQAQHILDPIPIKQTVRTSFGEFWRTHQDTWPMLKDNFTEEQLSVLTDLLAAPSYFS